MSNREPGSERQGPVHGRTGRPGPNVWMARAEQGRESSMSLGFGPHLIYDGFGCPVSGLEDLRDLYRLLDTLPERIHMTKIMPPYVFRHQSAQGADGYSGFVLIAESHISIHTFPEKTFVSVDIFSCKPFDSEFAASYLKKAFGMTKVDFTVLDRGTEFPKQLDAAAQLVRAERRRITRPAARA